MTNYELTMTGRATPNQRCAVEVVLDSSLDLQRLPRAHFYVYDRSGRNGIRSLIVNNTSLLITMIVAAKEQTEKLTPSAVAPSTMVRLRCVIAVVTGTDYYSARPRFALCVNPLMLMDCWPPDDGGGRP